MLNPSFWVFIRESINQGFTMVQKYLTFVFLIHWNKRAIPTHRKFLRANIIPAMKRAKGK